MTTEAVDFGIRAEHLIEYNMRGLKLVGLGKDGVPTIKWARAFNW